MMRRFAVVAFVGLASIVVGWELFRGFAYAGKRSLGVGHVYGAVLQHALADHASHYPAAPASVTGFWTNEMEPRPCPSKASSMALVREPRGPACHSVEVRVDEPNLLWGGLLPERITIWTTPVVWSDPGYRGLITRLTTDRAAVCASVAALNDRDLSDRAKRLSVCGTDKERAIRTWVRVIPSMARECTHPSPGETRCAERSTKGPGAVQIG